jgi:DNA-damage-inducible protein D
MKKISKTIAIFNEKQVRRHWDSERELWYFSIMDIISILTNSSIPKRYWSDLKNILETEGSEVYEKIVRLKMKADDGKMRDTDTADTETIFRIIQSIPSPNY